MDRLFMLAVPVYCSAMAVFNFWCASHNRGGFTPALTFLCGLSVFIALCAITYTARVFFKESK